MAEDGSVVSPIVKVNIRGDAEIRRKFAVLRAVFPELADRALKYEADDVLKDALEHTPMKFGKLRATGRRDFIRRGTGYYAGVHFGGTEETNPYALAIHEEPPSPHHPPSWQKYFASERGQDGLKWTTPGTGHKYLENALRRAEDGMIARMAQVIRNGISTALQ